MDIKKSARSKATADRGGARSRPDRALVQVCAQSSEHCDQGASSGCAGAQRMAKSTCVDKDAASKEGAGRVRGGRVQLVRQLNADDDLPAKASKSKSKSTRGATKDGTTAEHSIDVSNPFLLLINPKMYSERVKPRVDCLKKDGLIYTPVDASMLHRPKRIYLVKKRDPQTNDLITLVEAEYNLRYRDAAEASQ